MRKINISFVLTLIFAFSGSLCQIGRQSNNVVGIKIQPIKTNASKLVIQQPNAMTFQAFAKRLLENPSSLLDIKNIYIIQWPASSPLNSRNYESTSPPPINRTIPTKNLQQNIKNNLLPQKPISNITLIKQNSIINTNNKTQVIKKNQTIPNNLKKVTQNQSKPSVPPIPFSSSEKLIKTQKPVANIRTQAQNQQTQSPISQQAPRRQPPPSAPLTQLRDYMVYLTNKLRKQYGARQLTVSPLFTQIAQDHSDDMVRRRFFAHENPDGQRVGDRARRNNYYGMIGQNLAISDTLDQAQDGFKNSITHFQNAKNSTWQQIGVGITINQRGQYLITIILGPRNIVQYKLSDQQVITFRDMISSVIKQQNPNLKTFDEKLSQIIKRWLDSDREVSVMNFVVREGRYRSPMTAATYSVEYSRDMVDRIQKNQYFKNDRTQFSRFGVGCKQNGQKLQIYVIYM